MSTSTPLYERLLSLLSRPRQLLQVEKGFSRIQPAQRTASQHSRYSDWRHLKALGSLVNAHAL